MEQRAHLSPRLGREVLYIHGTSLRDVCIRPKVNSAQVCRIPLSGSAPDSLRLSGLAPTGRVSDGLGSELAVFSTRCRLEQVNMEQCASGLGGRLPACL